MDLFVQMKFKPPSRYSVPESEDYEPGSNNQVLKNFLGITSKNEIDLLEVQELKRTELELIEIFDENHQFTSEDICNIHELWLGDIYPFAGNYRTVNMEKDGFLFSTPNQIPQLMSALEQQYLAKYTPCHAADLNELAFALGVVHVELILIHPFREGNGRVARLLVDLMALQAGRPQLDFSLIDQTINLQGFKKYVIAIHAGLVRNYKPIQEIFKELLKVSDQADFL